jgi:hypothetical protein
VIRVRRVLFHMLSVASSLVLVLAALLWTRSYWYTDYVLRDEWSITSADGALVASQIDGQNWMRSGIRYLKRSTKLATMEQQLYMFGPRDISHSFAGFAYYSGQYKFQPGARYAVYQLPLWSITLAALPLPVWWILTVRRRQRERRVRHGRCPHCSYDLRAHAPGQACPECGTPVSPSTPSTSRIQ